MLAAVGDSLAVHPARQLLSFDTGMCQHPQGECGGPRLQQAHMLPPRPRASARLQVWMACTAYRAPATSVGSHAMPTRRS